MLQSELMQVSGKWVHGKFLVILWTTVRVDILPSSFKRKSLIINEIFVENSR